MNFIKFSNNSDSKNLARSDGFKIRTSVKSKRNLMSSSLSKHLAGPSFSEKPYSPPPRPPRAEPKHNHFESTEGIDLLIVSSTHSHLLASLSLWLSSFLLFFIFDWFKLTHPLHSNHTYQKAGLNFFHFFYPFSLPLWSRSKHKEVITIRIHRVNGKQGILTVWE